MDANNQKRSSKYSINDDIKEVRSKTEVNNQKRSSKYNIDDDVKEVRSKTEANNQKRASKYNIDDDVKEVRSKTEANYQKRASKYNIDDDMKEIRKSFCRSLNNLNISYKESHKWQWISGLVANTTLFTYGMQSAWLSPNLSALQNPTGPCGRALTAMEISWIASVYSLSAGISSIPYGIYSDKYGRKIALIGIAIPQLLSLVLKLISASVTRLLVSQIFAGIAAGGIFGIVPVYNREISSASIRGAMCSFGIFLQGIGTLLMFIMGMTMEYYTCTGVLTMVPCVNLITLFCIPESPPYLINTGNEEKALKVIAYLNKLPVDNLFVMQEMHRLMREQQDRRDTTSFRKIGLFEERVHHENTSLFIMKSTSIWSRGYCFPIAKFPTLSSESYHLPIFALKLPMTTVYQVLETCIVLGYVFHLFIGDCQIKTKAVKKAIFIAFTLESLVELGGILVLVSYTSWIIGAKDPQEANYWALLMPISLIVGITLALFIVEKVGRRVLFLTCVAGTVFSLFLLAITLHLRTIGQTIPPWLVAIGIVLCIFFFSTGVYAVAYVVITEIFSYAVRSKLMGIILAYGWILCFVQVAIFPPLTLLIGMYPIFYFFAIFNIAGGIVCYKCMPETKGKLYYEVEKLLLGEKSTSISNLDTTQRNQSSVRLKLVENEVDKKS